MPIHQLPSAPPPGRTPYLSHSSLPIERQTRVPFSLLLSFLRPSPSPTSVSTEIAPSTCSIGSTAFFISVHRQRCTSSLLFSSFHFLTTISLRFLPGASKYLTLAKRSVAGWARSVHCAFLGGFLSFSHPCRLKSNVTGDFLRAICSVKEKSGLF